MFLGGSAAPPAPPDPGTTTARAPRTPEAYGWIAQAMADCEVLAKQNADVLYFLIVPVKPSAAPAAGLAAGDDRQPRPDVAALLASADALVGLRNGALELYRDPLTFAVKDPDTNTTYKWKPANGVSELKSRELKAASLTLGIELDNSGDDRMGPDDRDRQGLLLLDQSADPARRGAVSQRSRSSELNSHPRSFARKREPRTWRPCFVTRRCRAPRMSGAVDAWSDTC